MAFRGRIYASINRYGQETVKAIRPMERGENVRLRTAHNAVAEIVSPDRPLVQKPVTVHPGDLK